MATIAPNTKSGDAVRGAAADVRSSLAGLTASEQRIQPDRVFGLKLYWLPTIALLASVGAALTLWQSADAMSAGLRTMLVVMFALCWAALAAYVFFVHTQLIAPMRLLRKWAVQMCSGNLEARIPTPQQGEFGQLVFHVNRLSQALDRLANDMDDVVGGQTRELTARNRSLGTLYDVAAALSRPSPGSSPADLENTLAEAAAELLEIVDGKAAILVLGSGESRHLVNVDGLAGIVAGCGAGDFCPPVRSNTDRVCIGPAGTAAAEQWPVSEELAQAAMLSVPLRYRDRQLGTLELFVADDATDVSPDLERLLLSAGSHIGMAIEKHDRDEESRQIGIMRERNALSHELHDSLAQTIASLGLQVKMLRDALDARELDTAARRCMRMQGTVEDVHVELRELLANFRAPVSQRGLLEALTDVVERTRAHVDCPVYLQHEGDVPQLDPRVQHQVVCIVSEALTNARKHSEAHVLRVLVRGDTTELNVLVEDDGKGIGAQVLDARRGEHLGLSVMRERAERAGGSLQVESEPDEGTRVELRIAHDNAEH